MTWFEEVLFYRLIVLCDDYGRFDGDPDVVRSYCFPRKKDLSNAQIEAALHKLSQEGMAIVYEFSGNDYIQLCNWSKYQSIRAKESKYPAFDNACKQLYADDYNGNQMNANESECARIRIRIRDTYADAECAAAATKQKSVYTYYEQNIGLISPAVAESMNTWLETMQSEVICAAISEAVKNGAYKWSYVESILRDCHNGNVHTIEEWDARQKQREQKRGAVRAKQEPQPESQYTIEEIQRLEAEWSGRESN